MSRDDDRDNDLTESMGDFGEKPDRPRIEKLGHFKIEATLGSGGMGTIYKAYDESMKRMVALKVLHRSLEISKRSHTRFVREAWIVGQLDHPNIIKVYSRGEENKVSYLALELADGGSLADVIRDTRALKPSASDASDTLSRQYIHTTLEKFVELTGALEHIHSKGFIHRDIKPHNILRTGPDQKYKFTDFGIAHAEDMTRMTKAGDFIGTVRYMSPELLAAHRAGIDKRTDIYSLGVTLYEALTLSLPFSADSEERLIREILSGHSIPARRKNRWLSRDLETVLMKACHHDPDLRYQTAADFAEDLQRIIDGRPILARRPGLVTKGYKYLRRNYKTVLGIAVAGAVMAMVVLWSYYQVRQAYRSTSDQQSAIQTSSGPTFTKIKVPGLTEYCALSPDGEKIAFVAEDSCLWVAPTHGPTDPTVAGEPLRLTEPMVSWTGTSYPTWSADGKWIAFNARGTRDSTYNVWFSMLVISSSGGEPIEVPVGHKVTVRSRDSRLGLSPDGQHIFFSSDSSLIPGESKFGCIYTMPVEGGEIRRLTDSLCGQVACSPDGKMIAYVKGSQTPGGKYTSGQSDIWVVSVAGETPIQITDLTGIVTSPVWSPDSRRLSFGRWSDHSDLESEFYYKELYVVNLSDRFEPQGAPIAIDFPHSSTELIGGWSTGDQIGLIMKTVAHGGIYTIPATGGNANPLVPFHSYSPRWSPDDRKMFFLDDTAIFAMPLEGGQPAKVPIIGMAEVSFANCDVSPDGAKLAFAGMKPGDTVVGIYSVSTDGGAPDQLVLDSIHAYHPCWSPDGNWIAFSHLGFSEGSKRWIQDLCVIPSRGGEARVLVGKVEADSCRYAHGQMAWSPDGKFIAYPSYSTFTVDSLSGISKVPFEGGDPELLVELKPDYVSRSVSWSPDGKKLAYCSMNYAVSDGSVWVLPIDTGEPVKLRTGLELENVWMASWSPDGEKIAFTCHWPSERDFYLLEDFLPSTTADEPEPPAEPTFSTVSVPGLLDYCALSPDGERIAFVADDSCLWVAPTRGQADSTVAGEAVRLTEPLIEWAKGSLPVWSANGNWIAFNTSDLDSAGTYWSSMYVMPSSGGDLIELPVKHDRDHWLTFYDYRLSLSPDGEEIAFFSHTSPIPGDPQEDCIYTMPVAGGEIRRVAESLCGDSAYCAHPTYSADGKLIAFLKGDRQCGLANEAADCDIWVVPVNGGSPVQVTSLPGVEFGPVWSPDGTRMAYSHWSGYEDHGAYDIKEISIVRLNDNYQQVDSPAVIKLPLPSDDFIGGWSTDDEIGLVSETEIHSAIYTVSASGGVATMVRPSLSRCPSWSPDGESIFYLGFDKVYSAPLRGGQESTIPIDGLKDMGYVGGCDLSPDGTLLALTAARAGDTMTHIFAVSARGGEARQVTFGSSEDWFPRWSPDGNWTAFSRAVAGNNSTCDLAIVSAEDGEVKTLVPWADSCSFSDGLVDWSPDGKFIAYPSVCHDSVRGISIVPVNGGAPEVLVELEPGLLIISLRWSPDGTKLAYSVASTAYGKRSADVWILPLDSRRPSRLKILANDLDAVVRVDWSPDGQKLAFEGILTSRNTLCLIRDFWPED
ncbi:MAG TPA: protein kinase [Sedimentisphaerales bacterium]|nr:protein kinase [Sedimentisphaerales bacterium]